MKQNATKKLLSDQVSEAQINVILRELDGVIRRGVDGDVVELGCYVGTTSVFLARTLQETGRTLWLYDSFAGLPMKTDEDNSPLGEQFRAGELTATRRQLEINLQHENLHDSSVRIKKAWFSDLTAADIPGAIAFAFLDGDFYSSINDSFRLVWPQLSSGGTVIVDDYGNQALPGASKAVDEWVKKLGVAVKVEANLAIVRKP